MNEVRRVDRDAEEIARIREIVARHALPNFVTGFDVQLGEFDGEPAMWIAFHTTGGRPVSDALRRERVASLRALREAVHHDLLAQIENRYPYYRFTETEHPATAVP